MRPRKQKEFLPPTPHLEFRTRREFQEADYRLRLALRNAKKAQEEMLAKTSLRDLIK